MKGRARRIPESHFRRGELREGSPPRKNLVARGDPSLHSEIRHGNILAYPTESFYALGADATDAAAIRRLYRLKRRETKKPIALVAAGLTQVQRFFSMTPAEGRLARRYWPGPLTILLRPKAHIAARSLGARRIGVRVPAHAGARRLARLVGAPITATSANRSGEPPTKSVTKVKRDFPGILLWPGRCGQQRRPSTIVEHQHGHLTTIRPGAVSPDAG